MARNLYPTLRLQAPALPGDEGPKVRASLMAVKPVTRASLVADVLDRSLHVLDRRMAARQIVRNYPSVIASLEALIHEVCPFMDPPPELFDILCDAWSDVAATRVSA